MATEWLVEPRADPYRPLAYLLLSFTLSYALFRQSPPADPAQFLPGIIILSGALSMLFATIRPLERIYTATGDWHLRHHMTRRKARRKNSSFPRTGSRADREFQTPFLADYILCYERPGKRFRKFTAVTLSHRKTGEVVRGIQVKAKTAFLSPYLSHQRGKVVGIWYFFPALLLFVLINPLLLPLQVLTLLVGIGGVAFATSLYWFYKSWFPWTIALHLNIMVAKCNEVLSALPRIDLPVSLFRDVQNALRNEDDFFASEVMLELDRRYSFWRNLVMNREKRKREAGMGLKP